MKKTLSVIVPVYNSEKYLNRCLDSILAQTAMPDEIICVNDGSTDDSGKILEEYASFGNAAGAKIKIINKENGGLVSARKAGIKEATSDYVTYVDADDFIEANMYEKLLGYASKYDADLVTSGFIRDYGDNVTIEKEGFEAGFYDGRDYKEKILTNLIATDVFYKYNILTSLCNKIFKREKLLPLQLQVDERIYMGEDDAVTYPYLFASESIYVSKEEYYHYCIRNDSMTGTKENDDDSRVELMLEYVKNVFTENKEIVKNLNTQYKFYELNYKLMRNPGGVLEYENGRLFPFGEVLKNEKIVLYGAGALGLSVEKWMVENGFNIVAHADKNGGKNGVILPQEIRDLEFSKIIITTTNATVTESIRMDLGKLKVPGKKILSVDAGMISVCKH